VPLADTLFVKDANGATLEVRALPAVFPVTGAFWQATQPVSLERSNARRYASRSASGR
jgi:hypothetical protein